jgi:Reverse transcriptase (RNA-dependent DNA polymerase)
MKRKNAKTPCFDSPRQKDDFLKPTRGLRQGCPLSPYLFVLSMEFLTKALDRAMLEQRIHGVKLALTAPTITHSIYADDLVILAKTKASEVQEFNRIMNEFREASDLKVNPDKSRIWFSRGCSQNCKNNVLAHMNTQLADEEEKYLGVMVHQKGGVSDRTHIMLEERLVARFGGWKMNLLSHPDRLVLLKSVLASIPVYYMSSVSLPWRTTNRLNSLMRKFYWGKLDKEQFIAFISWEKMCRPLDERGLNIKDLRKMNEALLIKLT